jgi:hypothetical protein
MWLDVVVGAMVVCSVGPALLFAMNLRRYRAPRFGVEGEERVTVLIPARDEEQNIRACVEAVLASREVELEVIVCDDDSADRTAKIVLDMAAADRRVHLLRGMGLPKGWNGKQHACWELAEVALTPLLLFLDADVRVGPWAIARCVTERKVRGVALLSGFPRQVMSGWLDALLLPLIHFVLLAFLPMKRMQTSVGPEYAAGCGQFFLVERTAYFASGGHAAIRETRHDGLRLPRLMREAGFRTDLVDLTRLVDVRMYSSAKATWNGLVKNATEGMASPGRIVPFTLLLGLGQVLPGMIVIWILGTLVAAAWMLWHHMFALGINDETVVLILGLVAAVIGAMVPRFVAAKRFQQPMWSAWLHPVGVAVLLVLQWWALLLQVVGRPVKWRARS